jgi:DNA polymerase III sliding clamp (beta) subunit (PCNA family)
MPTVASVSEDVQSEPAAEPFTLTTRVKPFRKAFDLLSKLLPKYSSNRAAVSIKLTTGMAGSTLQATDLDCHVVIPFYGNHEGPDGFALLQVEHVKPFLKGISDVGTDRLTIDSTALGTVVRTPHARSVASTSDHIDTFPAPPEWIDDASHYVIPSAQFMAIHDVLSDTTDSESTRYALGSILLEFAHDQTGFAVAADGRRMGRLAFDVDRIVGSGELPSTMMVPLKVLAFVRGLAKSSGESVMLQPGPDGRMTFKVGPVIVSSKQPDGRFPRYQDCFAGETDYVAEVSVDANDLLQVVTEARSTDVSDACTLDILLSPEKAGSYAACGFQTRRKGAVAYQRTMQWNVAGSADTVVCLDGRYMTGLLNSLGRKAGPVGMRVIDSANAVFFSALAGRLTYVIMPMTEPDFKGNGKSDRLGIGGRAMLASMAGTPPAAPVVAPVPIAPPVVVVAPIDLPSPAPIVAAEPDPEGVPFGVKQVTLHMHPDKSRGGLKYERNLQGWMNPWAHHFMGFAGMDREYRYGNVRLTWDAFQPEPDPAPALDTSNDGTPDPVVSAKPKRVRKAATLNPADVMILAVIESIRSAREADPEFPADAQCLSRAEWNNYDSATRTTLSRRLTIFGMAKVNWDETASGRFGRFVSACVDGSSVVFPEPQAPIIPAAAAAAASDTPDALPEAPQAEPAATPAVPPVAAPSVETEHSAKVGVCEGLASDTADVPAPNVAEPIPADFPADLARDLASNLAALANYREAIARGRTLDAKHGGDGRYVDDMRKDTAGSFRRSMLSAVRSIREFVRGTREQGNGDDPVPVLRSIEAVETGAPIRHLPDALPVGPDRQPDPSPAGLDGFPTLPDPAPSADPLQVGAAGGLAPLAGPHEPASSPDHLADSSKMVAGGGSEFLQGETTHVYPPSAFFGGTYAYPLPHFLGAALDVAPFLANGTAQAARAFLQPPEWSPMQEPTDYASLALMGLGPVSGGSEEAGPGRRVDDLEAICRIGAGAVNNLALRIGSQERDGEPLGELDIMNELYRIARALSLAGGVSPPDEAYGEAINLDIPPVSGGSEDAERPKVCPACGSESGATQAAFDLLFNKTWQVYCGMCEHKGQPRHSPRLALADWNATPRLAAAPPHRRATPQLDGSPESIPAALEHIAREYNASTDPIGDPLTWLASACEQGAAEIRRLRAEVARLEPPFEADRKSDEVREALAGVVAETWQLVQNAANHGDGRPSEPVKALANHAIRLAGELRQLRAELAERAD